MGVPTDNISVKSLGGKNGNIKVKKVEILGSKEKLSWKQYSESLVSRNQRIFRTLLQ
jgi:alpha-L-fucosidase